MRRERKAFPPKINNTLAAAAMAKTCQLSLLERFHGSTASSRER
jgi:hypothetical protein